MPSKKKIILLNDSKPKKRELLRTAVEDAISQALVAQFQQEIVEFSKNLYSSIRDNADLYVHGGFALHTYAEQQEGLTQKLKKQATKSDEWRAVLEPVLSASRDIDMSVVMKPSAATGCKTFQSCLKNETIKAVLVAQRALRHKIHERLRAMFRAGQAGALFADIVDKVNEALVAGGSELRVESLDMIDSSHIYIEPGKNGKVRLVDRHARTARDALVCDGNNMPAMGSKTSAGTRLSGDAIFNDLERLAPPSAKSEKCYPLRDSLNMVIEFDEVVNGVDMKCSFVLSRLALMVKVGVSNNGVRSKRTVPVNFLDVSILRKNDHAYNKTVSPSDDLSDDITYPPSIDNWNHLPYPSLGYVAENTLRQLYWNAEQRDAEKDETSENRAYLDATVAKLLRRLEAIAFMMSKDTSGEQHGIEPVPGFPDWLNRMVQEVKWWRYMDEADRARIMSAIMDFVPLMKGRRSSSGLVAPNNARAMIRMLPSAARARSVKVAY